MGDRVLVGLRVEVEVLDDERTSTSAVFKDSDACLTYLLLPCRLIVVIRGCDLLVGLEAIGGSPRWLWYLMLSRCKQLAGCPGCGVIAQGHGRMVVEVIDAPWAGVPARIRWFSDAGYATNTPTFLEHDEQVWWARIWVCGAIRWAIRQLRFEEPPPVAWLDNMRSRGDRAGPHHPAVCKPHLMTRRFAGVGCWGYGSMSLASQDRRRQGPP